MKIRNKTLLICVALWLLSVSTSRAAFITAISSSNELIENETAQISLFLNLEANEVSSVFEGVFDLNGFGSVADVNLSVGGPSWPNQFGNIASNQVLLSLTSNNDGTASRQIALLDVLAKTPGVFELTYDANTFASFDINASPFVQDLALSNIDGESLARINVVPIPAAIAFFLPALGGLSLIGCRRQNMNNKPSECFKISGDNLS